VHQAANPGTENGLAVKTRCGAKSAQAEADWWTRFFPQTFQIRHTNLLNAFSTFNVGRKCPQVVTSLRLRSPKVWRRTFASFSAPLR
jgi:hypothetical protein